MANFEILKTKLDSNDINEHQVSEQTAVSARSLLSEDAQGILERNHLAPTQNTIGPLAETMSRLAISTTSGVLADLGLHFGGLTRIPKIGTPLAVAAPFLLSGMVSSYLKDSSFSNLEAIGEGALMYGGFHGINRIFSTINLHMYKPSYMSPQVQITPLPKNYRIKP